MAEKQGENLPRSELSGANDEIAYRIARELGSPFAIPLGAKSPQPQRLAASKESKEEKDEQCT